MHVSRISNWGIKHTVKSKQYKKNSHTLVIISMEQFYFSQFRYFVTFLTKSCKMDLDHRKQNFEKLFKEAR